MTVGVRLDWYDPSYLSPRARVYMGIAAVRHLLVGLFCFFRPGDFTSPSYNGVKGALPFVNPNHSLQAYGVFFILTALTCAWSVVSGREGAARAGLLFSVVTTGFWVGGFFAAALDHTLGGPTGPVVWTAIVAKDLTMLREPLRNPFEPLVRRVIEQRRQGG